MRYPFMIILVFSLLLNGSRAAEHPDISGADWVPLIFKNFSNVYADEDVWSFQDGVLTATEDRNLYTKRIYEHFILDLEFKNEAGTNSGVILYVTDSGNWVPNSVEIQIADDFAEKWANSPASWQCGAIFGHQPARVKMVKKPGEWNRMTIYAYGQHLRVILNGEEVINANLADFTSAKINPDGSEVPSWLSIPKAELPTYGHIGLQGKHGDSTIFFRNIQIKDLD